MFKIRRENPASFAMESRSRSHSDMIDTAGNVDMNNAGSWAMPTQLGVIEGIVSNDPKSMRALCRDQYRFDGIVGAAIDLLCNLPFGEFSLSNVPNTEMLDTYMKTCESIRIQTLLPLVSNDYLVNGAFFGVLSYDADEKIFDAVVPQNLDNVDFKFLPVFGQTPLATVNFPPEQTVVVKQTSDPRMQKALRYVTPEMRKALETGRFDVPIENAMYLPRRIFSYDTMGTPLLQRLVPYWLLEKAVMRGSIALSHRRQRPILHIQAGDMDWTPTQEDLDGLANVFSQADRDPIGAVISTRPGVNISEVQNASDVWRADQMFEQFTTLKLRALGVGDSFLNTDVNVSAAENSMNVFFSQLKSFRSLVTKELLYNKIFLLVAATNGFKKDDYESSYASTRDRVKEEEIDSVDYHIPRVTWHTQLGVSRTGNEYIEILKSLTEQGLPIPARMLAVAAGISIEDLVHGKDEDLRLREELAKYNKAIADMKAAGGVAPTEGGDFGSFEEPPNTSILTRDYGDLADRCIVNLDSNGRRQVKSSKFVKEENDRVNKVISEAAKRMDGKD